MADPAATTRKRRSFPKLTRIAHHEAGHAVLSAAINDTPDLVSIRAKGVSLGRSRYRMEGRPETRVQVHLAGFAAEELLKGRRSSQLTGKELGYAVLVAMEHRLASHAGTMDGRDEYLAVQEVLAMGCARTSDAIRAEIERFYIAARDSLAAIWPTVQGVAKALLKHEELDRRRMFEAIGGSDIYGPVFAVQDAHGLRARPASAATV